MGILIGKMIYVRLNSYNIWCEFFNKKKKIYDVLFKYTYNFVYYVSKVLLYIFSSHPNIN